MFHVILVQKIHLFASMLTTELVKFAYTLTSLITHTLYV